MNKHTGRWNEWSAQTLLEQCALRGITHAVICPGSRSTALAIAAHATPSLNTTVHFDERGAAFYALGLAKNTRKPVVVITTSGTAVANLLPAAVEAFQSRTPLLFLTADRPPELRGCGANQAIDQIHLFGRYAVYFSDILCSDSDLPLEFFKQQVDAALTAALKPGGEGMAHLNLMFREPFVSDAPTAGAKLTEVNPLEIPRALSLSDQTCGSLVASMNKAEQGILIIGALTSEEDPAAAKSLARSLGWPCVTDIASGLRFSTDIPGLLPHMDLLLCHEKLKWLKPDVVLWVGGPFVSKRLLEWVGKDEGCQLIRIHEDEVRQDPLHRCKDYFNQSVSAVWNQISGQIKPSKKSEPWLNRWKKTNQSVSSLISQGDLLSGGRIRETDVAQTITDMDEVDYQLFVGNSLAIREVDQVGRQNSGITKTGVNRGASGIDGLIATASGYAFVSQKPTLALLGDLSALHDINSLALASKIQTPFVLVVLNNKGGGIFQFLPVHEQTESFESCFIAPQQVDFESLSKGFGIQYRRITNISDLKTTIKNAFSRPEALVIEVQTDKEETLATHQDWVAQINRLPV